MTGFGKGCFNLFVGSLLIININDTGRVSIPSLVMGVLMVAAGVIFIFLSRFKQMSDQEIDRAVSVTRKSVANAVVKGVHSHKDQIGKAAYDNREVVAQVAYDNKDVIAQAAYDNRELLADTYLKNQNN